MKLTDLATHEEVLAEDLRDPEFRAEWERTAVGRLLANELIRYRAEHELSQRDLAKVLELTQPAVARLELGEHNPRHETILRLVSRLGIEVVIDYRPTGQESKLARKRVTEAPNAIEAGDYAIALATA